MTINKIDQWTPEYLRSLRDDEQGRKEASQKLRGAFRTEAKQRERNTIAAAYAIPVLVDSGETVKSLEDSWGTSHSLMMLWKRLGRAAHRFGITPTSGHQHEGKDLWAMLNGDGVANTSVVAKVLDPRVKKDETARDLLAPATEGDWAALNEALNYAWDNVKGKKRTTEQVKNLQEGRSADDNGDESAPKDSNAAETPVAAVLTAEAKKEQIVGIINGLTSTLPGVRQDAWRGEDGVYAAMAALVSTFEEEREKRAPKKKTA